MKNQAEAQPQTDEQKKKHIGQQMALLRKLGKEKRERERIAALKQQRKGSLSKSPTKQEPPAVVSESNIMNALQEKFQKQLNMAEREDTTKYLNDLQQKRTDKVFNDYIDGIKKKEPEDRTLIEVIQLSIKEPLMLHETAIEDKIRTSLSEIVNTAYSKQDQTQKEVASIKRKIEKMTTNLNQVYKPVLDLVPQLSKKLDESIQRSSENMETFITMTHNIENLNSKVSAHYTILNGRIYPQEKRLKEIDEYVHRGNDYYEKMADGDDHVRKTLSNELALLQKKVYRVIYTQDNRVNDATFQVDRIDRMYKALKQDILRHETLSWELVKKFEGQEEVMLKLHDNIKCLKSHSTITDLHMETFIPMQAATVAYEVAKGLAPKKKVDRFYKHFCNRVVKPLERNIINVCDPTVDTNGAKYGKMHYQLPPEPTKMLGAAFKNIQGKKWGNILSTVTMKNIEFFQTEQLHGKEELVKAEDVDGNNNLVERLIAAAENATEDRINPFTGEPHPMSPRSLNMTLAQKFKELHFQLNQKMLQPINIKQHYQVSKNTNSMIYEMLHMNNVIAGEHLMVIKNQGDEDLLKQEQARKRAQIKKRQAKNKGIIWTDSEDEAEVDDGKEDLELALFSDFTEAQRKMRAKNAENSEEKVSDSEELDLPDFDENNRQIMNLRELTEQRIEEADANLYTEVQKTKKNFNEYMMEKSEALSRMVRSEFEVQKIKIEGDIAAFKTSWEPPVNLPVLQDFTLESSSSSSDSDSDSDSSSSSSRKKKKNNKKKRKKDKKKRKHSRSSSSSSTSKSKNKKSAVNSSDSEAAKLKLKVKSESSKTTVVKEPSVISVKSKPSEKEIEVESEPEPVIKKKEKPQIDNTRIVINGYVLECCAKPKSTSTEEEVVVRPKKKKKKIVRYEESDDSASDQPRKKKKHKKEKKQKPKKKKKLPQPSPVEQPLEPNKITKMTTQFQRMKSSLINPSDCDLLLPKPVERQLESKGTSDFKSVQLSNMSSKVGVAKSNKTVTKQRESKKKKEEDEDEDEKSEEEEYDDELEDFDEEDGSGTDSDDYSSSDESSDDSKNIFLHEKIAEIRTEITQFKESTKAEMDEKDAQIKIQRDEIDQRIDKQNVFLESLANIDWTKVDRAEEIGKEFKVVVEEFQMQLGKDFKRWRSQQADLQHKWENMSIFVKMFEAMNKELCEQLHHTQMSNIQNFRHVSDFMNFQTIKDKQDFNDREAIALVGLADRESLLKKQGLEPSKLPEKAKIYQTEKDMMAIDQKCFNCYGTNGFDKSNILSSFKMACLNYRPSAVMIPSTGEYTSRPTVDEWQSVLYENLSEAIKKQSKTQREVTQKLKQMGDREQSQFEIQEEPRFLQQEVLRTYRNIVSTSMNLKKHECQTMSGDENDGDKSKKSFVYNKSNVQLSVLSDPAGISEISNGDIVSPKFSPQKKKSHQEVRRNIVKLQRERERMATKSAMDTRPQDLLLSPQHSAFKGLPQYDHIQDEGKKLFDSKKMRGSAHSRLAQSVGRQSVVVNNESTLEQSENNSPGVLTPSKIQVFQRKQSTGTVVDGVLEQTLMQDGRRTIVSHIQHNAKPRRKIQCPNKNKAAPAPASSATPSPPPPTTTSTQQSANRTPKQPPNASTSPPSPTKLLQRNSPHLPSYARPQQKPGGIGHQRSSSLLWRG